MDLNFEDMLEYVKHMLIENKGIRSHKPQLYFRNRFEHIKRVYGWAKRIIAGVENCDESIVLTAAIFHDCGYTNESKKSHATLGANIFLEYALKHSFAKEFTDKIYNMILNHSNKGLIKEPDTPIEMIVLLEADLIDEEGALGVVFDLLAEGFKCPDSYDSVFNEIMIHSAHILNQNYMVTPVAKEIWENKKEFIKKFIADLKYDLFME
ncbi:MAG: HD domain-containing protein [Roseburia sp.]|nr:HD domain-containing protein [Anaeroplasma bactoclasticum]MCM1195564.1 HD domain-containing protein [Roseburia sp.]MCM1555979.1 HD domain-containing protein [Anaeroplasma bactoclasticum]